MKRLSLYTLLLTLFTVGCNPVEPVPNDSLSIVSGVTNNTLTLDGAAGSKSTFAISSKLAWEVLDTPGVEYSPNSGEATTKTTITATALQPNRTLKTITLGAGQPFSNPDRRCREVHFFSDVPEIDRALAVQDERRTVFIDGQTIILHVFSLKFRTLSAERKFMWRNQEDFSFSDDYCIFLCTFADAQINLSIIKIYLTCTDFTLL